MSAPRGRITTFYSYKGGTGRSMALANFAWIVAASGKRVLAIDWDLEAPGLHRYFRPFLVDSDLFETDGLIDAFWQFAASAMTSAASGDRQTRSVQMANVSEALEDSTRRLDYEFASKGYIDFIGAGRQGATYSERVNTFDWKRFYELGGAQLLTTAKDYLRGKYDWVLIDSRTGVSDTSGICTVQMPDAVVACFTMNRQSIDGVTAILRSIRAYRSASVDGSGIVLYPVATRIENGEGDRLEIARSYARTLLRDFLPERNQGEPRGYWDKMEISYRPKYAFEEVLAAFGDATGPHGASDTMVAQVESMSQLIADNHNLRMPEVLEEDRARVLKKYTFDGKQLPAGHTPPAVEVDAADSEFRRRVIAKEQLWRSVKFDYRALLSRGEANRITDSDRKVFGRDVSFYIKQSEGAHSLLAFLNTAFAISVGTAITAAFLLYLLPDSNRDAFLPGWSRSLGAAFYLFAAVVVFVAGLFLFSLFRSLRGDLPEGIRGADVFALMTRVPFGTTIPDYVPD